MATVIDALIITLGLDPKGVNTGIKQAESALDAGVKNISTSILAPLTALLAGAFAGGAIIQRFIDAADLGKLSTQLRVGVVDLQAWQGAAVAAGGSAAGLVESAKALQQSTGSRLPITTQLLHMSDQLRGLSEIRAMEFGKKMGLDEGTIKLLRQGRQAVVDMVNQQRELVAFSKQDVEAAQSVKKSYEALKSVFFMVGNVAMKFLLPPFRWVAEKMREAGGIIPTVTAKLTTLSQWISMNGPQIQNVFMVIATVLTARMVPALWATARAAFTAMLPFLPFIALVAGLALVFDDLVTYINGGESAFEDFWAIFGTGPELAAAFAAGWETVKVVLGGLWDILTQLAKAFLGLVTFNPTALTEAGYAILNIFSQVWEKLDAILGLGDKFAKFGGWVSEKLSGAAASLGFADTTEGTGAKNPAAMASAHAPVSSAMAVTPELARSGTTQVSSQTQVSVGQVVVQTQATDAQGMAAGAAGALHDKFNSDLVLASNTGVALK